MDTSLWLEDGNVVLSMENVLFKVHCSMLTRLSPFFRSRLERVENSFEGLPMIYLDVGIANSKDLEALLQHLYHNMPFRSTSPFGQTARILRSAEQFHFQELRDFALGCLEKLYPRQPLPFEYANWPYLHEATRLALDCGARQILPALLYAIVTTLDFDVEEITDEQPEPNAETPGEDDCRGRILFVSTARLCLALMNKIMEHFTPILFTVPTSSHMECTGVFADHWMEYAIQPAIVDSGVYKPLETLKKIQAVDWKGLGLCDSCCVEKKEEWDEEAANIWAKINAWAVQ